jgi:hypothetical protein
LEIIVPEEKQNILVQLTRLEINSEAFCKLLDDNQIRIQCHFLVKDFINSSCDIIQKDGLCTYRAFFIADKLNYDRSSSINDVNEIKKADPDFTISNAQGRNNKKTNPREEFLKYLKVIAYNAKVIKRKMDCDHKSYSFALMAEKFLNNVLNDFKDKMLIDSSKEWISYCETKTFCNIENYGSYREILFSTEEKHQNDVLWWIDVTTHDDLMQINRENPVNRWITLEINSEEYFRESYVDANHFEENLNFISTQKLINTLSSTGFHFLMSTKHLHACFVPFPLLTKEDVEDLIFNSLR